MMHDPTPHDRATGARYWLDERRNVRKLLFALYAACALLFAADLFYRKHAEIGFDGLFGFYGVYGFVACVALVLAARELRKLVSRPPDYYDDADGGAGKNGADGEGRGDA